MTPALTTKDGSGRMSAMHPARFRNENSQATIGGSATTLSLPGNACAASGGLIAFGVRQS